MGKRKPARRSFQWERRLSVLAPHPAMKAPSRIATAGDHGQFVICELRWERVLRPQEHPVLSRVDSVSAAEVDGSLEGHFTGCRNQH
jgi:hypothetical protein